MTAAQLIVIGMAAAMISVPAGGLIYLLLTWTGRKRKYPARVLCISTDRTVYCERELP